MPASSHDSTIPEKQLLLCCARTKVSSQAAKKVRDLLRYEVDWKLLLAEAHEHSVFPLLERHLRSIAPELIPPAAVEQLKTESKANAVRCLALSGELIRVADALEAERIHSLPYKGPVTAAQAYGDITAREFEDLDVVLRQRDIESAHEVVRKLGYEPRFPSLHAGGKTASLVPGEYNYSNEERRTILELHTELTLRHFPDRVQLDEFFVRAVEVDLGGRSIRTFAPEDALIFLSVHAAKDFWQKLVWVADVAELIQAHPRMNWPAVMQRARELGAQRMLHVSLALAQDLFDTKLLMEVAASVQADAGAEWGTTWAADNFLLPEPQALSSRARFHFRRKMAPGFFAGWRYSLGLALAPAEDDWTSMRLPRPLAPLYILLRPLRLLRKYGWTERQA